MFEKNCHSRPLFLYFRLFNTVFLAKLIVNNIAEDWIRSLILEATTQPTAPQPLPMFCLKYYFLRIDLLVRISRIVLKQFVYRCRYGWVVVALNKSLFKINSRAVSKFFPFIAKSWRTKMNKNLFSQIREIFVCGKRHYSHYYTLPLVITCTISVTCVASITLPISLWPYHCLCLHQLFADSSSNLPALNYYLCLSVERLDASLYTLSFSATFM